MDEIQLDNDVESTRKEAFFQTPLWYLEDSQWGWLKASSPNTLKRAIYHPNTSYGIGKIIEMSIYPQTTAIYSLLVPGDREDLDPEIFVNEKITEVKVYGNRVMLTLIDPKSPQPEELEVHLRSFLNLYIAALGEKVVMAELDLQPGELLSYSENITFEKGVQIESLSH
jgi:hypothetical protein